MGGIDEADLVDAPKDGVLRQRLDVVRPVGETAEVCVTLVVVIVQWTVDVIHGALGDFHRRMLSNVLVYKLPQQTTHPRTLRNGNVKDVLLVICDLAKDACGIPSLAHEAKEARGVPRNRGCVHIHAISRVTRRPDVVVVAPRKGLCSAWAANGRVHKD